MRIYKIDCLICRAWFWLKRNKYPAGFICKGCKAERA